MTFGALALCWLLPRAGLPAAPVEPPPAVLPSVAPAKPVVYALIIANNDSFNGKRPSLRFADDDGARYAELLSLTAKHLELLSVFDADTQHLFPDWVARTRPPRRSEVLASLDRLFAEARRDVAAGNKVVFYFIFSGHGDVADDETGYIHLLDAAWTRSDLYEHVLARSPASVNHVIIDACNSYYLVARRGTQATPAGDYSRLVRDFLNREHLAAYPTTGVLLSTSRAAEVHEWGRLEAGLFSHALRSAMAGAGDADGNGVVDYDEAAAFVAAANAALPDRKARIEVFSRPPAQNLAEPLAYVPAHTTDVVVPAAWLGHFYLQDDRGVRYADFNKTSETAVRVSLVPRPRYHLRGGDAEYRVEPADASHEVRAEALPPEPLTLAARGVVDDAFDRFLFAVPFGPGYVVGFRQARLTMLEQVQIVEPSPLTPWRYAAVSGAAVTSLAAGILEVMARSAANEYRNGAGTAADLAVVRGRAESLHRFALLSGGVALSAAASAAVLYWLDD